MEYCLRKVGVKAIVSSRKFRTQDYYEILSEISPEIKYCKPGSLESARLPELKTVIIADEESLE